MEIGIVDKPLVTTRNGSKFAAVYAALRSAGTGQAVRIVADDPLSALRAREAIRTRARTIFTERLVTRIRGNELTLWLEARTRRVPATTIDVRELAEVR
jgi:hypothetical protein